MDNTSTTSCITMLCILLSFGLVAAGDDRGDASDLSRMEERIRQLELKIEEIEERHGEELAAAREQYRAELRELRRQMELQESGDAEEPDELRALREEAERAAVGQADEEEARAAESEAPVGRQRALQALNPEISFLGDFSYDWTDTQIQDQFLLRGAEISFQSVLDPYTRFKGYVSAHQEPAELLAGPAEEEGHEEISVNLEEAFMEWVALPLNSRLRVGRFRQQFGTLNRWHPHALPSVDVPFALRNLFTDEGLIGLGVGLDLPIPHFWATTSSLTVELVNPDNESAFAGASFSDPAVLLRHTGFFDLGSDAYIEIGLNGTRGPNDDEGHHTTIGGIELNYVWEPVQRSRYRGLELRGEYLRTRFDVEDASSVESQSWYAYATWKLSRRWSVGLRRDDAELPWDRFELTGGDFREGLRERGWTSFFTFWQSEYVRLRTQYQHVERDFSFSHGPDDDDRLWIQVTFAAGPHKHEAY